MPSPLCFAKHVVIISSLLTSVSSMPAAQADFAPATPDRFIIRPPAPEQPGTPPSPAADAAAAPAQATAGASTPPPPAQNTPGPSIAPPLVGPGASNRNGPGGCGNVSRFFGQTPEDWTRANTGAWLDRWWDDNSASFKYRTGGFAAVFGEQYLGNPDWTCRMDGSASNCDYNPCQDSGVLEQAGTSVEPAYYVIESINRFHAYFKGLSSALEVSGIFSALMTGSWVEKFWLSPKRGDPSMLRILAVFIIALVAVASAALAIAAPISSAVLAGVAGVFGGVYGAVLSSVKSSDPGRPRDLAAADAGRELANSFIGGMKLLIHGNDQLMAGNDFGGRGDIRTFLKDGSFVNYPGINQTLAIDYMNTMLLSKAINNLWRRQKVFIMGGGPCEDKFALGQGPAEGRLCRDGKAWYLYFWKERTGFTLKSTRWGWLAGAPGAEDLGKGEYQGISVQDVIKSSLDAYTFAGYNYTEQMAHDRASDALTQGWASPVALGPAWEGIFDIPVCDISSAIESDIQHKDQILKTYGEDKRPRWCGSICGTPEATRQFIEAANMKNFKSPKVKCSKKGDF